MKGYADKIYRKQQLMRNKVKQFELKESAQEAFEKANWELCEASVLSLPTCLRRKA